MAINKDSFRQFAWGVPVSVVWIFSGLWEILDLSKNKWYEAPYILTFFWIFIWTMIWAFRYAFEGRLSFVDNE